MKSKFRVVTALTTDDIIVECSNNFCKCVGWTTAVNSSGVRVVINYHYNYSVTHFLCVDTGSNHIVFQDSKQMTSA